MTATSTLPTSPPTAGVRECSDCRVPLGAAARYCLHCGARQGHVPPGLVELVAPRPVLSIGPAADAGALAPPRAPVSPAALAAPSPAPATVLPAASSGVAGERGWPFALTAVVLLALVIGLFAGGWLADRRGGSESGSGTAVSTAAAAASAPTPTAPAAPTTPPAETVDPAETAAPTSGAGE